MTEIASESKEETAAPRALFRQPLALQWLENGNLVKRTESERQAGRFELFLDLLYVAILANFAQNLAGDVTGARLVQYILILAPTWHIWSDLRELMNSFYTDDMAQRIFILWIMALLVVYGNNATLVGENLHAMWATVGSYIVARMSSTTVHLLYSFSSYHHRRQQRLWFCLSLICLSVYIPLFFESVSIRSKVAVASVAIIFEECVWIFCYSPASKRLLNVKYSTAVDIPHEIDRFAAFFIIVLGEFVYAIVVGSPAAVGFNDRLYRAILTLIIAFSLNWLYVHNDGAIKCLHPLRHSVYTAFPWIVIHLPLSASLLAGGHVAAMSASVSELERPELWLLCGSLGTGMILMYVIAVLCKSQDEPGKLIVAKSARIILRLVAGIIMIFLPLSKTLDVTAIMSIIMALIVLCVIWENVTSLMRGAKFWEPWKDTKYPEHIASQEDTV
ncbi:Low temperature requirement A [Lipomyces kononenkoae]|uniref:Low temperature requirement A n=1 Tax=Lipomyces kononenkoae TaxID=34357 RepID=A0ACC3SWS5_LIPKO